MIQDGKERLVIGLMSGTSLDGIDAALVKIENTKGLKIELVSFLTVPYPDSLREKLISLCNPKTSKTKDVSIMNMYLGELLAEAAVKAANDANIPLADIDLISSHGHTVFHQPEKIKIEDKEITSTMQIGDIGVIAERTGITTVGDFRTRDMAAGGQGAPLAPMADYLLMRHEEYGRAILNIGGISNITILPPDCKEDDVIAYDTGPGNMLIDLFTYWGTDGKQSYDKDGRLAAQGKENSDWIEMLLGHPYFQMPPPKSTGREEFGLEYGKRLWEDAESNNISVLDRICTITRLSARSIAAEINKYIDLYNIKEVLVNGGGYKNRYLINSIKELLSKDIDIWPTDRIGINSDAKEAIAFALFGYLCYKKQTNNLPSATGALKPVIMGKIAW